MYSAGYAFFSNVFLNKSEVFRELVAFSTLSHYHILLYYWALSRLVTFKTEDVFFSKPLL